MNSTERIDNLLEMGSFGVSLSRWENSHVGHTFHICYQATSFGYIVKGCVDL